VLIVAVLYWAQAILVRFALSIVLTFVPTPPVNWLERWVGRVTAVVLAATLVGLSGWVLAADGQPHR
jgi:predicted PurR-regulated permease PerM